MHAVGKEILFKDDHNAVVDGASALGRPSSLGRHKLSLF